MNKGLYAIAALVFIVAGCDLSFLSNLPGGVGPNQNAANVRDVAGEGAGNAESPARNSPAAHDHPITLRITNAEPRDAQCSVTMTLAEQQVHFSFRKIPAQSRAILIGPDQADEIRVEATFLGDSPRTLDAQILRMGHDYDGGDVIDITLRLPVEQEEGGTPPPPPPAEPAVAVAGLDTDISIDAGEVVAFTIETSNAPTGATVAAIADPDSDPTNGNEITIAGGLSASAGVSISWNTAGVTPGTYMIYGILSSSGIELRSDPAPGRVIVSESVPPPPPATIAISGLDLDARVNPGTVIGFDVLTGNAPEGATVAVYGDGAGANTTPVVILADTPAAGVMAITWDTSEVPPDTYTVRAELHAAGDTIVSASAPGRIIINALPSLRIVAPQDGFAADVSEFFHVTWDGSDPDDDAIVTIFLDADGVFNGNEVVLDQGLSEDDPDTREVVADIFAVPRGTYFVGGTINDGLATVTTIGPRICVVRGRNGTFEAATLPAGKVCVITPDPNAAEGYANAFGASLDISTDLGGDGIADLLIGEPATGWDNEGGAYYHADADGDWPHDLSATDLQVHITGQTIPGYAGQSVAFAGPFDPNAGAIADVVVGDPAESYGSTDTEEGTGRFYRGSTITASNGTVWPEDGTALRGDRAQDHAGIWVAALGDVNGDGWNDVALGAPGDLYSDPNASPGQVAIVFGGQGLPEGTLLDVGRSIPGVRLLGENARDLTGTTVVDAGEFTQTRSGISAADMLIGAPGADGGAGKAYLVLGESISGASTVDLAQQGTEWQGTVFLGEPPESGPRFSTISGTAGRALAVLDFNGDGRPDVVIGAPGIADYRGRVYVVFNTWTAGLPAAINLADVGTAVPGVRITGSVEFDQFGSSLVDAGDLDGDGYDDLAIGAPLANEHGNVYVIYGGQDLPPALSADDIGTCDAQGWVATGSSQWEGFGTAIAGHGDLDGDGLPDLAVGSPSYYPIPNEEFMTGRAMLLFSPPVAPPLNTDD